MDNTPFTTIMLKHVASITQLLSQANDDGVTVRMMPELQRAVGELAKETEGAHNG